MKIIKIYTDGACRGNPGPGGWGALILKDNEEIKLNGGQNDTTNNQMELTAVIKSLDFYNVYLYLFYIVFFIIITFSTQ